MKATNVLAAAVLIGGGVAGCASMEAMPAASPAHELHTFVPGREPLGELKLRLRG